MGYMSHKILFVDDCSTTLLLEQIQFVGRPAHNLVLARNGQEVIQKAMREQPRLILMDATPHNMESCREMRKIEQLQRVPILLISSAADLGNIRNVPGSSETMPLMWNRLNEMVDSYLSNRQATDKARGLD